VGHDTSLAAERAILESARTSIAGGQAPAGFARLQQHAREFPRGRLAEEREGLWIRALMAGGRMDEARDRFERFRRSYPKSMLLPAFEESLGGDPGLEPKASSH
jgi:outer membrane protein assembly factor BamD (BamD/ComL family)